MHEWRRCVGGVGVTLLKCRDWLQSLNIIVMSGHSGIRPACQSYANLLVLTLSSSTVSQFVTYAYYACVADCADTMADAWKDTAGCAEAICLHENLLKCQYIVKWGLHGIVHI